MVHLWLRIKIHHMGEEQTFKGVQVVAPKPKNNPEKKNLNKPFNFHLIL